MNRKTLNTVLTAAAAVLGTAALVLILLSVFSERKTLIPGLLCVAAGTVCNLVRTRTGRQD